jgi:hypothetical protein
MFRSKAFSARPVYFLSAIKSRPDIAIDLCHRKKDAYLLGILLDNSPKKDKIRKFK